MDERLLYLFESCRDAVEAAFVEAAQQGSRALWLDTSFGPMSPLSRIRLMDSYVDSTKPFREKIQPKTLAALSIVKEQIKGLLANSTTVTRELNEGFERIDEFAKQFPENSLEGVWLKVRLRGFEKTLVELLFKRDEALQQAAVARFGRLSGDLEEKFSAHVLLGKPLSELMDELDQVQLICSVIPSEQPHGN